MLASQFRLLARRFHLGSPVGCVVALLVIVPLAISAGCGRQPVAFDSNELFAATLAHETGQPMDEALRDTEAILTDLFGTPAEPRLPELGNDDPTLAALIDRDRLMRAAGPVASDRKGTHTGLYRKYCSTCHGITGDGLGPAAAVQNPYPRDFRVGVFKYKSTPRGDRPTHADLARTIRQGLPGTSMPAFGLLPPEDLQAVIDYVTYLSIRGELERRLLAAAATEYDYSEGSREADQLMRPSEQDRDRQAWAAQQEWIESEIGDIVRRWASAPSQVPSVAASEVSIAAASGPEVESEETEGEEAHVLTATPDGDAAREESLRIGRELFRGQIANCASCHGEDGTGGKLPLDYDDWTKEWTTRLGIDPQDREKLEPFHDAGALRPLPLPPRNLTLGGFRGGRSPRDIYLRILHGIDGTPMPAINRVETESETGLTDEQIWHLVRYVTSLFDPSSAMGAVQ